MRFIVKRNRWLRGEPSSWLHRPTDHKQCCIGFVCRQLGATVNQVCQHTVAYRVKNLSAEAKLCLLDRSGSDRNWVQDAYGVNDDLTIEDGEREKKLKAIFKRAGHQLIFK